MNPDRSETLMRLKRDVLDTMAELDDWSAAEIRAVESIPLTLLQANAVYRHGVTRFKQKRDWPRKVAGAESVREVGIHRDLLDTRWWRYAKMVLHHEYVHCVGFIAHDERFYTRERIWPDISLKQSDAREFMLYVRASKSRWLWCCEGCDLSAARQRRSNGRYLCRRCGSRLIDKPANGAQTVT